jgi:UDP-2,3-diacylglucosamine pyrophosphatase LpxH
MNKGKKFSFRGIELTAVSDLHLDFHFNPAISLKRKQLTSFCEERIPSADILLIAGDVSAYIHQVVDFISFLIERNFFQYIVYVPGNHELYLPSRKMKEKYKNSLVKLNALKDRVNKIPNVYLLDGTTTEIHGIKIGGTIGWYDGYFLLQRNYSLSRIEDLYSQLMNDSRFVILPGKNFYSFSREEKDKLHKIAKEVDIVITHVPPLLDERVFDVEEEEIYKAFYAFDGKNIIEEAGASIWIYGHTHHYADFTFKNVRFLSSPIGYF